MALLKILFFSTICISLVLPFPLENPYRNEQRMERALRVSAVQNEPFINRDSNGGLNNGIEFELLKTIADRKDLKFLSQNQSS